MNSLYHTCTHLCTPSHPVSRVALLSHCHTLDWRIRQTFLLLSTLTPIPAVWNSLPHFSLNCQLFRSVSEAISSFITKETTSLTPHLHPCLFMSCCYLWTDACLVCGPLSVHLCILCATQSEFARGKCVSQIAFYYLFTWLRKTSVVYLIVNSPS